MKQNFSNHMLKKQIMMGKAQILAFSKIYERTENAYEGITHFFFNVDLLKVDQNC